MSDSSIPKSNAQEKQTPKSNYNYASRGHVTKGSVYKDRYVEKQCPECGYAKSYKDEWRTKISYKCLRRNCRYNWFEDKEIIKK